MKYLVLYQKNNGELIYRYRKTKPQYETGSTTSMGWKLLDIKYLSSGNALSYNDYSTLIWRKNRVEAVINWINKFNVKTFVEIGILLTLVKIFS